MTKRKNEAYWADKKDRWQINVQNDGERKSFYSSIAGKKGKIEAERKADKWLDGGFTDSNIRFAKLWEEFLSEESKLTGTANVKQHYSIGKNHLLPALKTKRVMNITEQDWQDCINNAYKKGLAKKTCANIRGAITAFYKYAKKRKISIAYPEDLIIPKNAPVKAKQIMQPSDIKILFTCDTIITKGKEHHFSHINAFRFIVLTGLRRGELCGLKYSDLNDNMLNIQRAVNGFGEVTDGKNANAKRSIYLPQRATEILQQQKEFLQSQGIISPWIFPNLDGNVLNPNSLYRNWYRYRGQHGIKSTIHELRHTMISISKADVPEQLLKQIVGHSDSMDTFGIYGHTVDGEIKRTANILDDVYNKILG